MRPNQKTPVTLADLRFLVQALPARARGPENETENNPVEGGGRDWNITGDAQTTLTGVTLDSRGVLPGDLYAALPGSTTHGAKFAGGAVNRGAAAILTDRQGAELIAAEGISLPLAISPNPREDLGFVAAHLYGNSSVALTTFGLTGTNGKTTTAYLLAGALESLGRVNGLIGTNGTFIAGERLPTQRTTPEATDLHAIFGLMHERGATSVCMEVSSHALTLHRVDGIVFDVAGFTNLTQDHLDFHPSMEDYFQAKADLFTVQRSRAAVVCVDDEWGVRLVAQVRSNAPDFPVLTYATTGGVGASDADFVATEVASPARWSSLPGFSFSLQPREGEQLLAHTPLAGRHNMANATLAILMLHCAAGVSLAEAANAVACSGQVPGRMEFINPSPAEPSQRVQPRVYVDFAHSADSIAQACVTLRPLVTETDGRLIIVIGAGGDRDALKRPLMGAAAVAGADIVIVTDDNPRSEDPATIRAAVKQGAYQQLQRKAAARESLSEVVEIPERKNAIIEAIRRAEGRDVVLLAGKGSESGQEVNGVVTPFDDRDEARTALAELPATLAAGPTKPSPKRVGNE